MAAENNIIDYEQAVNNLTETLKKHVNTMSTVVQKYSELNKQFINLPSEYIAKLNSLASANDAVAASQKKVVDATININQAVQQRLTTGASLYKQQQKETAAAEKQAAAEEKAAVSITKSNQSKVQKLLDFSQAMRKQREKETAEVQKQAIAEEKAAQDVTKAQQAKVQRILNFSEAMRKQREKENLQLEKQNQLSERLSNFYNKVQNRVNELSRSYNDLALKQQLGMKLTTSEIAQLDSLTKRLNTYQSALIKVDSVIQKNQRRVGDYASGWNGLSNSINQITRELPAFTFSAQTGFLALSNNIPILVDEIQRVSKSVAELRAQGKQVPGVMSQILSSFLSWQTVLSVGVTLVTVYGKEIGEFVVELFKAKKAIDFAAESKKAFNNVSLEANKNAQKEIIELNNYIKVAQNSALSTDKRQVAVKKLQELYPQYFKDMSNDEIMTSNLTVLQNKLTKALLDRALAVASISKMTENAGRILDLQAENELEAEKIDILREQSKIREQESSLIMGNPAARETAVTAAATRQREVYNDIDKLAESRRKRLEEIQSLEIQNSRLAKQAQKNTEQSLVLDKPDKPNKVNNVRNKDAENSLKKAEKQRLEYLQRDYEIADQLIQNEIKVTKNFQDQIELRRKAATLWFLNELSKTKGTNQELLLLNAQFTGKMKDLDNEVTNHLDKNNKEKEKGQKKLAKSVADTWKNLTDYINKILDDTNEESKKKTQERIEWFKNIGSSGFSFSDLGFGSLDIFSEPDAMQNFYEAMADSAVSAADKAAAAMSFLGDLTADVFAGMKRRSDAYYENEFAKLEKEKDIAIKYAGENTAGREAIERQYEERKLALKRQQAQQEKKMAIFEALINVAKGVVKAIAENSWPYNLVIAGLVGALGAVQIANIQSQPLPAFWKGTQNAPEGWAIVDELRPEIHTDKKGNIKSTGSKKGANLRYLEKGDKIFPSHDAFFREMNTELNMSGSFVDRNGSLHIDNGISKEDLREVMKETIGSQSKTDIMFDVHGFTKRVTNGYNRTLIKKRSLK